ncbi:thiol-disulfide oxidoreductase DCC family protein [Pseudophaeobacter sp.]|uniref:thiol-disulfide oxidoreductase DCC family protein n=1 Tax=Pseudophaeobacter sp. TaxID=1971739 RepID=UPI004059818A
MTKPLRQPEKLTVFYDGSCPLCASEIDLYNRANCLHALRFVDVSSKNFTGDAQISQAQAQAQALARFHIRLPDGQQLSGAQGFIEVWRVLPSWNWMAKLADRPAVTLVLELLYRLFLPLRPLIAACTRRWHRNVR